MLFFIDTANVREIREAADMGLVDGVTTNPTLVARERRDFHELLREICGIVDGPVSAEVMAVDTPGMLAEAERLCAINRDQITIKLPMTLPGLVACRALAQKGVKTNLTLVFHPNQAILAAKAGATYVSPFAGRLDDIGEDGMDVVEKIIRIYTDHKYPTKVIVASVRNPLHVVRAAKMGADVVTIPFEVIQKLARHHLTTAGIAQFQEDWQRVPRSE